MLNRLQFSCQLCCQLQWRIDAKLFCWTVVERFTEMPLEATQAAGMTRKGSRKTTHHLMFSSRCSESTKIMKIIYGLTAAWAKRQCWLCLVWRNFDSWSGHACSIQGTPKICVQWNILWAHSLLPWPKRF